MSAPSPSPEQIERFRRDLVALAEREPGRIGIALSAGPDSLALLLLAAAAWPGAIAAATVDHQLRPESGAEAAQAATACAELEIPHRILAVEVAPGASVQAHAREARYAALADWAEEERIDLLLTGHHADDQAETLLMRLLRGSGVGGLAGVRARAPLTAATQLCRPLLGWRRAELAAIVGQAGLKPVEDPSNADERYDRVRMRRRLAEAPWIDPLALARSAAALAEADEALAAIAETLFAERVSIGDNWAMLTPEGVPAALLRRLVERALAHVTPGAAPRGEQLGPLIAQLRDGGTATLAGVRCRGGEAWRFEPEPPRRPAPSP